MAEVREIGVVGAGFMGSGIAESAARAGLRVRVFEPAAGPLEQSRTRIAQSVGRAVRGGKMDAEQGEALQERISFSSELHSLHGAELVIEAIVEDLGVKREVFRTLDDALDDSVILASNTSSIPIAGLAAATHRPSRVLGLHFFSPVPVM
jgi:3-hydroxybutyryl-CoA dehydrogenase